MEVVVGLLADGFMQSVNEVVAIVGYGFVVSCVCFGVVKIVYAVLKKN